MAMLCGNEYERIPITDEAEATLFGCQVGDIVVVRMLDDSWPESLMTPGCVVMIRLDTGELALGRLDEHEGQRLVTCASGTCPYDPARIQGFVVSQFTAS